LAFKAALLSGPILKAALVARGIAGDLAAGQSPSVLVVFSSPSAEG
jgi:hypothetical protein